LFIVYFKDLEMAMLNEGNPPLRNSLVVAGPITVTSIDTGFGPNEVYPMNQPLLTTSSPTFGDITCARINTGQGLNEVYEMNQNVKSTDAVNFLSVGTGAITCTSLSAGAGAITCGTIDTGLGATEVAPYIEDTHNSTWTCSVWNGLAGGVSPSLTIQIRKIGKIVILSMPNFAQTVSTAPALGIMILTSALPLAYRPQSAVGIFSWALVLSNSANVFGSVWVLPNGIIWVSAGTPGANFAVTGDAGIYAHTISYTTA